MARNIPGRKARLPLTGPILPPEAETDVDVKDLARQLAQLQKDLKDRDTRIAGLDSQNRKLLAMSRQAPVAPAPKTPLVTPHNMEIKTEALPDPVANPKEYAAELTKQLRGQVGAVLATTQAAQDEANKAARDQAAQAARVDAMWDKMIEDHPEFEGIKDIVEAQAKKIVQEGVAMGGSVEAIVFGDPDQFVSDVAARVTKRCEELGLALEDDGAADDTGDPGSSGIEGGPAGTFPTTIGAPDPDAAAAGNALKDKAKPVSRTALQGGDFGTPPPTKAPAQKPSDLVSDLRQIQSAMGLF